VTVTSAVELHDVTGTAFGRPLAFSRETTTRDGSPRAWHALAGVDVASAPGPASLSIRATTDTGAALAADRAITVAPRRFVTRRLRVASQFVDPSLEEIDRLRQEAARLEELFAAVTPRAWDGPMAQPVAGVARSSFGTRSVFNGEPRAPHAGVDFRGAVGTLVVAPAAGRVVLADPLFFTGQTVVIDHGAGLYSLLAHLSRIDVANGQLLGRGDTIGLLGATGRVTGPHLHWAVRLGTARVDAMRLVALLAPPRAGARSGRARGTSLK
jgi:murein DD-endopeptidase MepM/ murein hydrolase activator NlpD